MYLKSDVLPKSRADIITHLMNLALSGKCQQTTVMAVLDVRRHHLVTQGTPVAGLTAALQAELAYVAALWPNI